MQLMTFLWLFFLSHENVLIGGFCASVFASQLKRFRDFGLICGQRKYVGGFGNMGTCWLLNPDWRYLK